MIDLDEMSQEAIEAELSRRKKLRDEGRCDYCGRFLDQQFCKFPDRHQRAKNSTYSGTKREMTTKDRLLSNGIKWTSEWNGLLRVRCPYHHDLNSSATINTGAFEKQFCCLTCQRTETLNTFIKDYKVRDGKISDLALECCQPAKYEEPTAIEILKNNGVKFHQDSGVILIRCPYCSTGLERTCVINQTRKQFFCNHCGKTGDNLQKLCDDYKIAKNLRFAQAYGGVKLPNDIRAPIVRDTQFIIKFPSGKTMSNGVETDNNELAIKLLKTLKEGDNVAWPVYEDEPNWHIFYRNSQGDFVEIGEEKCTDDK